ncbi:MAG: hypothetical protein ACFB0G_03220 [Leptolyngbyaceae cyanobacterium]
MNRSFSPSNPGSGMVEVVATSQRYLSKLDDIHSVTGAPQCPLLLKL